MVIVEKWMSEGHDILKMPMEDLKKFIKKKLDDPDNRFLKATDKKI